MIRSTQFTALRTKCAFLVGLFFTLQSTSAQGTVQFGFEEFTLKDTPPFVTGSASVENSTSSALRVAAFEGEKFLLASRGIYIQSPNAQRISSFNIHVFFPRTSLSFDSWSIVIGDNNWNVGNGGSWQSFQGTSNSPVESLRVDAFYSFETISGTIGIDSVELVTVPEPQTLWLLTIGLAAISCRALLKRPKPNRA